ncbi:DUF305 domain-containing protein [Aggregatilineales bacterium SYSU G02658]
MKRSLTSLIVVLAGLSLWLPLSSAEGAVAGRAGRAEMRFLQGMIDHHQMALDMANDCLAKASTPAVVALCEGIISAQSAEIEQMQGWLLAWYNVAYEPISMLPAPSAPDPHAGHGGHGAHAGHGASSGPFTDPAMTMGMFAGLNRLDGAAYEIAWLEAMIDHHDDALHMSERLLRRVPAAEGHAELLALAAQIIADQSAEIDLMENLIVELGE